jgi:RNA polymerase sigma factor (TIGR02999 family)
MAETQQLLHRWRAGEARASDALIAHMLPNLRAIAAARLRAEPHCSLSTSDLIQEALVKIVGGSSVSIADRAHLLALASRIMRNVLIDHARARLADKRRHERVELHTNVEGGQHVDLVALETALIRLKALDGNLAEIIEMRYFGGMTVEEVALATGLSDATVKRRWTVARAWLKDALAHPIDG